MLEAKIENGRLIISMDANDVAGGLPLSGSGKSRIVATTGGNQKIPTCLVQGKPLTIGINAYIPA